MVKPVRRSVEYREVGNAQSQLAAVVNDQNLTVGTSHAFNYGASSVSSSSSSTRTTNDLTALAKPKAKSVSIGKVSRRRPTVLKLSALQVL